MCVCVCVCVCNYRCARYNQVLKAFNFCSGCRHSDQMYHYIMCIFHHILLRSSFYFSNSTPLKQFAFSQSVIYILTLRNRISKTPQSEICTSTHRLATKIQQPRTEPSEPQVRTWQNTRLITDINCILFGFLQK